MSLEGMILSSTFLSIAPNIKCLSSKMIYFLQEDRDDCIVTDWLTWKQVSIYGLSLIQMLDFNLFLFTFSTW